MKIKTTTRPLRILDFDIENRPLSYWYDGNPTAEITAIAASWSDEDFVHCWLLDPWDLEGSTYDMLIGFSALYEQADMVTGHYIRKHDLPIINGALMENGMVPLAAKLTHDTKLDLVRTGGISCSQESLGAMYRLDRPKFHMAQQDWRDGNRLTSQGLELTAMRVTEDVKQHKDLYKTLREHGVLKAPREWRP